MTRTSRPTRRNRPARRRMDIWLAVGVGAALPVLAAGPARAAGFYIQEQSVRGAARAYSGEASDVGVESMWWNPAAIARIPRPEAYVGVDAIMPDAKVTDNGSTIRRPGQAIAPVGGAPREFKPLLAGIPASAAAAVPLGDRFAVGLSVTSPFNFTNKYRGVSWTRYESLKSRLNDVNIELAGAARVTDWLDVGVGVDAQYASATLTQALPNLSPLLPDASQRLSGDGWGYGWDVGVQVHPNDRLTLSASYRSKISHKLGGNVTVAGLLGPLAAGNFTSSAKAKFNTPSIATVGARWQATDRLWLNAQVQRIGWSEFRNITVSFPGGGQVTPQNYRDTTSVALGLDYAAGDHWMLSAGAQYDPTPTPDFSRSTRVPDGNRWLIGLGARHPIGSNGEIEVSADYLTFRESHVYRDDLLFAGTAAATPVSLRGTVKADALLLGVGLRWGF